MSFQVCSDVSPLYDWLLHSLLTSYLSPAFRMYSSSEMMIEPCASGPVMFTTNRIRLRRWHRVYERAPHCSIRPRQQTPRTRSRCSSGARRLQRACTAQAPPYAIPDADLWTSHGYQLAGLFNPFPVPLLALWNVSAYALPSCIGKEKQLPMARCSQEPVPHGCLSSPTMTSLDLGGLTFLSTSLDVIKDPCGLRSTFPGCYLLDTYRTVLHQARIATYLDSG